jgi:long-chain acyl-CoA synthetase
MGGAASKPIQYAVPVTSPKEGETAIYRNPTHKDKLLTAPKSGARTIQEILLHNFKEAPNREYLGYRPIISWKPDEKTKRNVPVHKDAYQFYTFSQVEEKCRALGSGIENLGLAPVKSQYKDLNLRFIGIHSKNSVEWVLTDHANSLFGYTSMPLYDTLGEEAVDFMLNETETTTLFMTCDQIKKHVKRVKQGVTKHLVNFVIMDEEGLTDTDRKELEFDGIKWYTFSQVIEEGKKNLRDYPVVKPQDVQTFSYTSGTTGLPKGAMITNANLVATIAGAEFRLSYLTNESVYLSYLPLAHVLEKIVFLYITYLGAKYGIFAGDVMKLKDDLGLLKPTVFVSVPRLFNKFYDQIKGRLSDLTGCKSSLAKKAVASKLSYVKSGYYTHSVYDSLVFNKMKDIMGGRVRVMLSGSAPLSIPVKEFLKIAFCCPFLEGYGQTEGIGGEFVTEPVDARLDTVGGPLPMNEFKLIDVKEMNYHSTDKDEQGRLTPRGEVLVRGANIIPGYYKNDEKTRENIDEDGWLHSGDIAMVLPDTNALKIIDRRKNIFKLSQGEYIAPDKLEQIYKTTPGIGDIFVYGDSLKSQIVAIINLDKSRALKVAHAANIEATTEEELSRSEAFIKLLLDHLKKTAEANGLKGFERVVRIYIDPKPFADSDLVTTTFKLKRNETKKYYQAQIDKLYEGLE